MLPDDVFRAKRDRTIAALQQWHRAIADCAHVEEEAAASFWRLAVTPLAAGACPFEVILHQRQTCDVAIGPESYENRTSDELDRLPVMAEAIAAGRVLTRSKASAMTGLVLAVETAIRLAEDQVWKAERWIVTGTRPATFVREDRWYLPYRR
ncbi:MAG TPA: hypothetical protein VNZ50_04705 [Hyphomicrobiaceae bacterium]|nr:hypothetical protein [Hyphomicrobiaceae bacterium]